MKLKLTYKYHEDNVIPPRCRKPRTIFDLNGESTVTIKETVADNLELVCKTFHPDFNNERTRTVKDYFFYEGKVYTRAYKRISQQPDIPMGVTELLESSERFDYRYSATLKERRKEARNWASQWLIVDGEYLYTLAGEPRWVVMTFGLGCNHGGSGISLQNFYNGNISKSRYFRLDQKEEMYAAFVKIALGRGDDKSVPYQFDRFQDAIVYRPDLLKLDPNKEHGDGDPFINGIDDMISAVKDPTVSGIALMAQTASLFDK